MHVSADYKVDRLFRKSPGIYMLEICFEIIVEGQLLKVSILSPDLV